MNKQDFAAHCLRIAEKLHAPSMIVRIDYDAAPSFYHVHDATVEPVSKEQAQKLKPYATVAFGSTAFEARFA